MTWAHNSFARMYCVVLCCSWRLSPLVSVIITGTRTRGQVCTVALGCLIFFDDYSSILIVGNSLRDVVGAVGVRGPRCAESVWLGCPSALQRAFVAGGWLSRLTDDQRRFIQRYLPACIYYAAIVFRLAANNDHCLQYKSDLGVTHTSVTHMYPMIIATCSRGLRCLSTLVS